MADLVIPVQNLEDSEVDELLSSTDKIKEFTKKIFKEQKDQTDREKKEEKIKDKVTNMIEKMAYDEKSSIGKVKHRLYKLYDRVFVKGKWFKQISESLDQFVQSQGNWLLKLLGFLAMMALFDPNGKMFTSILNMIMNIGIQIISLIIRMLPVIIKRIIKLLPILAKAIGDALKRVFSTIGNVFEDVAKNNPDSAIGKLYSFLAWLSKDVLSPVLSKVGGNLDKILIGWGAMIVAMKGAQIASSALQVALKGIKAGQSVVTGTMKAFAEAQKVVSKRQQIATFFTSLYGKALKSNSIFAKIATFGMRILSAAILMMMTPMGVIILIITVIITIAILLYKNWDKVIAFVTKTYKKYLKPIVDNVVKFFGTIWGNIKKIWKWIKNNISLSKIWGSIKGWAIGMTDKIKAQFTMIVDKITEFAKELWTGLKMGFQGMIDYITAIPYYIKKYFSSDNVTLSQARARKTLERYTDRIDSDTIEKYATKDKNAAIADLTSELKKKGVSNAQVVATDKLKQTLQALNKTIGRGGSTNSMTYEDYLKANERLVDKIEKVMKGSKDVSTLPYIRHFESFKSEKG